MRCFIFYILLFLYYCFVLRKPSFGMRCPCDMQNVKREKNMFFFWQSLWYSIVFHRDTWRAIFKKNKEKKGNTWKIQDFKSQQRCSINSIFVLFLSSITQTYLIEDPGNQGSTLRLVNWFIQTYPFLDCNTIVSPNIQIQHTWRNHSLVLDLFILGSHIVLGCPS